LTADRLTRHFVLLRALRWLPLGLVLPFLVITPESRGLSLGAIGVVFAVHSAVAIALEVPSGALADMIGRRRVLLAGAALTAASLLIFAAAGANRIVIASAALLAAGRALISGSLEAWYVGSLRLLDPAAPISRGLSRGTAAEGIAMALGALVAGGLVSIAGPGDGPDGALSGYGIAALAGAAAALGYLVAVIALVHEQPHPMHVSGACASIGRRAGAIFATARDEFLGSAVVRIVVVTGVALGMSFTAVELLWQPRLADLLTAKGSHGVVFGALAAGSMLAVALGAYASERLNRRLGLRLAYLLALAFGAVWIVVLGAAHSPASFALFYLLAYFGMGLSEPMHYELLNDAVGPTARATLISGEAAGQPGWRPGGEPGRRSAGRRPRRRHRVGARRGAAGGVHAGGRAAPAQLRAQGARVALAAAARTARAWSASIHISQRPDADSRSPKNRYGRRPPNSLCRRCETPPSTDAIRRRGHPMESSICGNVRGCPGALASSPRSSRMRSLQRSWKCAISPGWVMAL
jgi:MFS family permease